MSAEEGFIAFVCPACNTEIEASHDMIGQETECPACNTRIIVPEPPPSGNNGVIRHGAGEDAPANVSTAAKSRTIRIELGDLGL